LKYFLQLFLIENLAHSAIRWQFFAESRKPTTELPAFRAGAIRKLFIIRHDPIEKHSLRLKLNSSLEFGCCRRNIFRALFCPLGGLFDARSFNSLD
jgi:hypothetical protein